MPRYAYTFYIYKNEMTHKTFIFKKQVTKYMPASLHLFFNNKNIMHKTDYT